MNINRVILIITICVSLNSCSMFKSLDSIYIWEETVISGTENDIRYLECERYNEAYAIMKRLGKKLENRYPYIAPIVSGDVYYAIITEDCFDLTYTVLRIPILKAKHRDRIVDNFITVNKDER